jgi:dihydrolipoamide dehydrogenase
MSDKYDVIVIGGGPAGYVAAIRCAQLGFKTVCVEKWLTADHKPALGGTCLNVGCIPSKALLSITHHYHHLLQHGEQSGIIHQGLTIDISKMMSQKQAVVKKLTAGIEGLFMANKVTWLKGSGQLLSTHRVPSHHISDWLSTDRNATSAVKCQKKSLI